MSHGYVSIALVLAACARPIPPSESVAAMSVPTGAWQRDWIQRHGGALEHSVLVRYVQTPSVFGDVRIPGTRPDLARATSFADLGDAELAILARQNGFAGVATIAGATASWHHEIDFQPTEGSPDIGRIELVGDGRMLEHALDGAYVERWSPLPAGAGPFLAVKVVRDGRADQMLAVAGTHFIYARARATALPPGDSITEVIARTHATREQIIAYLDCEISYGTAAGWQIEHSTLPWREHQRLAIADHLTIASDGQLAPRAPAAGEQWSIEINTLTAAQLHALFPAID